MPSRNPDKAIRSALRIAKAAGGSLSDAISNFSRSREASLNRPASGAGDQELLAALAPRPQLVVAEPEDERRQEPMSDNVHDLGADIDEGAKWLSGTPDDGSVAPAKGTPPKGGLFPQSKGIDKQPSLGSDDLVERTKYGLAGVESAGQKDPYSATGPVLKTGDRAYGKYQVMGSNIPAWTKEATGIAMTPEQYLNSPEAQEATVDHQLGKILSANGNDPNQAASIWFTGRRLQDVSPNASDGYTSNSEYQRRFSHAFGSYPQQTQQAATPSPAAPSPAQLQDATVGPQAQADPMNNPYDQNAASGGRMSLKNAFKASQAAKEKQAQQRGDAALRRTRAATSWGGASPNADLGSITPFSEIGHSSAFQRAETRAAKRNPDGGMASGGHIKRRHLWGGGDGGDGGGDGNGNGGDGNGDGNGNGTSGNNGFGGNAGFGGAGDASGVGTGMGGPGSAASAAGVGASTTGGDAGFGGSAGPGPGDSATGFGGSVGYGGAGGVSATAGSGGATGFGGSPGGTGTSTGGPGAATGFGGNSGSGGGGGAATGSGGGTASGGSSNGAVGQAFGNMTGYGNVFGHSPGYQAVQNSDTALRAAFLNTPMKYGFVKGNDPGLANSVTGKNALGNGTAPAAPGPPSLAAQMASMNSYANASGKGSPAPGYTAAQVAAINALMAAKGGSGPGVSGPHGAPGPSNGGAPNAPSAPGNNAPGQSPDAPTAPAPTLSQKMASMQSYANAANAVQGNSAAPAAPAAPPVHAVAPPAPHNGERAVARGGYLQRASGGIASMPTDELIELALTRIRQRRRAATGGAQYTNNPNFTASDTPLGKDLTNEENLSYLFGANDPQEFYGALGNINNEPNNSNQAAPAPAPTPNTPAIPGGVVGNHGGSGGVTGATGSPIGGIPNAVPTVQPTSSTDPSGPQYSNTLNQALGTNSPNMDQIFGFTYPTSPPPKAQPKGPVSQGYINALYGIGGGGSQVGTLGFNSGGAIVMDAALNKARKAIKNKGAGRP